MPCLRLLYLFSAVVGWPWEIELLQTKPVEVDATEASREEEISDPENATSPKESFWWIEGQIGVSGDRPTSMKMRPHGLGHQIILGGFALKEAGLATLWTASACRPLALGGHGSLGSSWLASPPVFWGF